MILLTTLLANGTARADWPTARHDPQRTGASSTGSNIVKPAAYWRARLGGALGASQVLVGDTDKDGAEDVLYIAGSELLLAKPDGTVLWRTGARGYLTIVGVNDLNGDGQLDVVVNAPTHVSVIAGATGAIEWEEPSGELGTPGAYRIADLDGDGHPDLWLDSCGCCAIENGTPGVLYSFSAGFSSPTMLGTPPSRPHCGASSNTVGDFVGDGTLQMISTADTAATLFRANGNVLGTSGAIPARAYRAQCQAANIDGKPGDELVCFTNSVYSGAGERGLFALAYRPGMMPPLQLLWNTTVSASANGDARAPSSIVADLDGDGRLEAIVSGKSSGAYTTTVLDAATGSVLATAPGLVAGDVPAASLGHRWLLVTTNPIVTALTFTRSPPSLTPAWQLSGATVAQYDWGRSVTSGFYTTLVTPDLNGDAKPDLVFTSPNEPTVVAGYDISKGSPAAIGQYAIDSGVAASAIGTPAALVGGAPPLFVARNDGFLALLSGALAPVNQSKEGTVTLPGMYVGGYYTGGGAFNGGYGQAPIAAKMNAGAAAESVLVVDSRGDVVRFDPANATNVAPAQPTWRLQDSFGAGIRPMTSGDAAIGVFRRRHPLTDPPVWVMAAISASGDELSSLTMPRPPTWDVVPGAFTGAGTTSFVGQDYDSSANTDIVAMGAKGEQLWKQSITSNAGTMPYSVADWNGDGSDDVAAVINFARVLSGPTGAALAQGTDLINYSMPILVPLTGGPQLDMLLQGQYDPVRALGHDLTPLWAAGGPAQPYPFGAVAACKSGTMLVEGSFLVPAQLALTQASGATPGAVKTLVLGSGAAYPDVASATSAKATLGQLTDVAVSMDLAGSGSGPTALVGSTDGYLYAVDACTGDLRWALQFGRPVGCPVLADTDGDQRDEILVSVADGYLYGLKNEILPAPAYVWDTDPPHGITNMDVDSIETVDTLYATWASVPGASTYEVAVVGVDGAYVTNPSWIDVGPVSSASIPKLSLVDGAQYFVGVRAVSPSGKSPDTVSNGVVVHLPGEMDAGAGSGGATGTGAGPPSSSGPALYGRACTCSSVGAAGTSYAPLAGLGLVVLTLLGGRRRGRYSPC